MQPARYRMLRWQNIGPTLVWDDYQKSFTLNCDIHEINLFRRCVSDGVWLDRYIYLAVLNLMGMTTIQSESACGNWG